MEIPKAIDMIPDRVKPLISNHLMCTRKPSLINISISYI